jgi:GNAT superfamily N-acetyltransferase
MDILTVKNGDFCISTDKSLLDVAFIHDFLSTQSYWAQQIPLELVQTSIEHSICFGVFHAGQQVGFARIISDCATVAYLADVFISEPFRGKGLSKWLLEIILGHPQLQGLRRWLLATADAHSLYQQFGFKPLAVSDWFMEIHIANAYKKAE